MPATRIAVIGLDGIPWSVLNKIVDLGYFGNIAEVLDNSFRARLMSTTPPLTPPAWTSIATGVVPGKHGIYNFHEVIKSENGFVSRLITGKETCYPRIHEILSMYKIKNIVANLPATYYVPEWVSRYSIVVSDWLSPSIKVSTDRFSYLAEAFSKNMYAMELNNPRDLSLQTRERIEAIIKALIKAVDEVKPWVVFTVFSELDWIMHKDKEFIRGKDLEVYKDLFIKIDKYVGFLRKKEYRILIVSDHGFHVFNKVVYPKRILEENGFKAGDISYAWKTKKTIGKMVSFIKKHPKLAIISKKLFVRTKKTEAFKRIVPYDAVQILMPDQYDLIIAPDISRKKVIEIMNSTEYIEAFPGEKVYPGYCSSRAPDIVLAPRNPDILISRENSNIIYREDAEIPSHHSYGVFSVEIGKNKGLYEINTWDVLPIVLSLLGLPIPSDTDANIELLCRMGLKVVKENIRRKWRLINKISRIRQEVID